MMEVRLFTLRSNEFSARSWHIRLYVCMRVRLARNTSRFAYNIGHSKCWCMCARWQETALDTRSRDRHHSGGTQRRNDRKETNVFDKEGETELLNLTHRCQRSPFRFVCSARTAQQPRRKKKRKKKTEKKNKITCSKKFKLV